jgi:hypothetical protein
MCVLGSVLSSELVWAQLVPYGFHWFFATWLFSSFNSVALHCQSICQSMILLSFVNIVLDGQNYPGWAFCVQTALRGHGLLFHLIDTLLVLADDRSNVAALKTRHINDGKVMSTMINSTKASMVMSLSKFTTAKAIWSHLKERFVQDSNALLQSMQQTHVIEYVY